MKRLQRPSLFATVQFLMITVMVSMVVPAASFAGTKTVGCDVVDEGTNEVVSCAPGCKRGEGYLDKNGKRQMTCIEKENTKESRDITGCEDMNKDLNTAIADSKKACSESGLDVKTCITEVGACVSKHNEAADNEALDLSALTSLFPSFGSSPLNIPSLGLKKDICPSEGSKDYFDEKDRLQRDLKEIDRENADIEKDIADEKSKLDKEMKDAQDELTRARKEVEKKKLELNKEEGERSTELVKRTQEIAKQLQDLNTQDLQKRAEITKFESDHNRRLLQLNEQMGQAKCMNEVRKARDEMAKAGLFATNGSSTFMANATAKQKTLQQTYDICVKDFHEQRIQMLNEYRDRIKGYNMDLQNIQEGIQSANAAIKNENEQAQKAIEDLKKAASSEDQNLIQQMQNAQNNLVNLNTTMQQKQNALRQKQASIQQRKIQLQKDLDGLGPVPKRGTKTGWREAERAVYVVAEKRVAFYDQCCKKDLKDSEGKNPFANSTVCTDGKQAEYKKLLDGDVKKGSNRKNSLRSDSNSDDRDTTGGNTKNRRGSK